MTIERAPSTNGRIHTNGSQPAEAYEHADEAERAGGITKLIVPALLVAIALVVLRRLSEGNAA